MTPEIAENPTRRKTACGLAWSLVCAIAIVATGCTGTGRATDSNLAAVSDAAATSRPLLHGGERGLEVRQWLIADDADLIASVMGRRGEVDVLTETERERLRRNGLRLVRVPLDALDSVEAELGGAFVHNVGWHGQVLDWQDVIARTLPQQRAVAVDGRVRLFGGGQLRLMTRAWLVQMEDGRHLNVQIVPQHFRPASMSYNRLLGRDTGEGAPIASMAIDLLLNDGYAYLLTCESPLVDWVASDEREESPDKKQRGPTAAGPDAQAATTIGQLLLRSEQGASARAGRAVLIFVPRIHTAPDTKLGGLARTLRSAEGAHQR